MKNSDKFLINVTEVLSKLTKVRIVKNYQSNERKLILNSWPLFYDNKNNDVINYLRSNDIKPQKIPFVVVYEISHEKYLTLENLNIDRVELVFFRNYLELKKIDPSRHGLKDVRISLAYDSHNGGEELLPSSTYDTQGLKNIANRRDVLFLFNSQRSGWKAKIRGDLGWFVFSELNWYPRIAFEFVDRNKSISTKLVSGNIANRYVTEDLNNYNRIVKVTKDNIKKILPFDSWSTRLKEITEASEAERQIQLAR